MFGPSKEAVWRQLAAAIDGRFVDGGWLAGDKVEAEHGEWTVTLDTYQVHTGHAALTFTRMRAPYVNPLGFRFTIYRRGILNGVAKLLGQQDIELGIEPFDPDFIIKATDESLVRALLSNERLRELIAAQPQIRLTVEDDEGVFRRRYPEGVDALHFVVHGVIKDVDRLKALYDLFALTLDELCRIGAARTEAPSV